MPMVPFTLPLGTPHAKHPFERSTSAHSNAMISPHLNLGYSISDRDSRESRVEQFAACVRITMSLESSKFFFEMARGVRDPVKRIFAYGLVGAATGLLVLSSMGVRQLEDQFDAQHPVRST